MPKPSPNPEAIKGTLLPRTSPLAPEDYKFNVLYAGAAKSGKTHCIASWPDTFCLYWDENLATIRKFPGVTVVPIPSWQAFETYGIPALQRRCWFAPNPKNLEETILAPLTCGTFANDSLSTMVDLLIKHLEKTYSGFELWKMVEAKAMYATRVMVALAKPHRELPSMNVLMSCHLRDKEGENGALVKTGLDIAGQSSGKIPRLFDSVFLTQRENTKDSQGNTTVDHFVYTVNPNRRFDFIGDGVGGGKFATLPAKTGGTYQELMTAWGVTKNNPTTKET